MTASRDGSHRIGGCHRPRTLHPGLPLSSVALIWNVLLRTKRLQGECPVSLFARGGGWLESIAEFRADGDVSEFGEVCPERPGAGVEQIQPDVGR